MKTNILYRMRAAIVWGSLIWDNSLSLFCISIIVAVLAVSNHTIVFLLPISIGVDLLILFYAIYKDYKATFSEMRRDISLFDNLERANPEQEAIYQNEITKTWQYAGGNKFGTKGITSYICKGLQGLCSSYSFYSDKSIILLHKDFDGGDDRDRFCWIHEMSHCCWHSIINQKRTTTIAHSVCLFILTICATIAFHSWLLPLLGCIAFLLMLFIESQFYLYTKREMDADAMALSLYSDLYGEESMRRIARIFTNRYYKVLADVTTTKKEGQKRINSIFNFLRFTTEEDQRKFMNKLDVEIADEDKNTNPEGKTQRIKLRALALSLTLRRLHRVTSFKEVFLTLNPPLYYIVFPALMFITYYVLYELIAATVFPWWCLLLVAVPIVLILILKKKTENLVIAKSFFIESIINR